MASYKYILSTDYEDIAKKSRAELAKDIKVLSAVANKRIKRLEESGEYKHSQVYDDVMRGGKFSSAGKNQGQLQGEFARLKRFLSAKTSTVSGAKEFRHRVEKRAEVTLSDTQNKEMWRKYRAHKSEFDAVYGSTQAQNKLAQIYAKYADPSGEIYDPEDIERLLSEDEEVGSNYDTDDEGEFFSNLRGTI